MGLFGPSKIKITLVDFLNTRLNEIFSSNFIDAETKAFAQLSKAISILQRVSLDKYLRERQNVIYNLFNLAWVRNIPYDIFKEYVVMDHDPRVKAINTGVYDRVLSRAQEAGMDTFGFISRVFISQVLPKDVDISDADYSILYEGYGSVFTSLYISYETSIKKYKFIK
jgi:hypothetical protein